LRGLQKQIIYKTFINDSIIPFMGEFKLMIENAKNKMIESKERLKRKIAIKVINFTERHYPEFINERVANISALTVKNIISQEMHKHGILHCSVPGCFTRYPLMNFEGKYVCGKHHDILSKQEGDLQNGQKTKVS